MKKYIQIEYIIKYDTRLLFLLLFDQIKVSIRNLFQKKYLSKCLMAFMCISLDKVIQKIPLFLK